MSIRRRKLGADNHCEFRMGARHSRLVIVYRYKPRWPVPEYLPKWGTKEAIATLDGCIPMGNSGRAVPVAELGLDGFLPLDVTPDDIDPRQ